MNDTAIKNYCIWARAELLNEVENRMQRYGVVVEGVEPAEAETVGGVALSVQERKQRIELLKLQTRIGHDALRDRAAYTWFNRIVAIRFMELHDYLPSGIRMFGSANDANAFEPQVVKEALDTDLSSANQMEVVRFMQTGEDEPLFRYLFLAQCDELAQLESLKRVFEPVGSALELLLPTGLLRKESVIGQLIEQLPYVEQDEGIGWDNVEILGWMYQFYNSEVKDEFFKSKRKATARDIAPATQLFTPEWIVRYMVENSLGRLWMLNNPESTLREHMEYYIEPDARHEDFIRIESPEEISLCDPACGSGHILVYAFSLLFQMYTERGYREREVPQLILQNNLTGMEIDPRAAQIAHLALAMCAREHDRRFFTRGVEADVNVIAPTVFEEGELPEGVALQKQPQLVDALAHLDEIGSLLNPTEAELAALRDDVECYAESGQASLFGANVAEKLQQAKQTCETLARKFTCVVANPPYMGSSSFSSFMSKWIKKNYPDVKNDLCTCFIERGFGLVQKHGYSAMVTMQSWMFLGSFEKMRAKLIEQSSIVSMAHIGARGFDSIGGEVVSTTATVFAVGQPDLEGAYLRLVDPAGEAAKKAAALEAIANPECGYFYRRNAKTFTQIPGTPIAYWASDALVESFSSSKSLSDIGQPRVGLQTGENVRFVREWWEVSRCRSSYCCESIADSVSSGCKWFPYNKGGDFRKWYGNNECVVDWENDGAEIRSYKDVSGKLLSRPQNIDHYFKPSITWSKISSGSIAFRFKPAGHIFDVAGTSIFADDSSLMYLQGLCNSSVIMFVASLLSPTLNFEVGQIATYPVIESESREPQAVGLVDSNRSISKSDWDSFETSWDFKRHPLV